MEINYNNNYHYKHALVAGLNHQRNYYNIGVITSAHGINFG